MLTYSYDKVGNLTSYTDAGGTVTYGYNVVNLLTTLTEPSGAQTSYGYDNANRRISMTLPSSTGITVSYGYDNAGHTTSIKAVKGTTTLLALTYSYTKSLKTGMSYSDNTPQSYSLSYGYDALNRLTSAAGSGTTSTSYAYDGAGNRTSATSNGVTTTYSYNSADELTSSLLNGTTTNYTYDGNGNQLTGAGRTFSINDKNQITGISTSSTADSYTYSGADSTDRVQVNGASTIYSSLGLSVDGAGGSSATYYTRTSAGQLVNERTTSGTYYYLMDDLGSVLKVVDSSGTVKNSYSYDPYGTSLNKSETVTNPWQYASGYIDANTGLYKFGARYYDPALARWTQLDSRGGGYVYVNDNPVSEVDPSGNTGVPEPGDCGESLVNPQASGFPGYFETLVELDSIKGEIVSFAGVLIYTGAFAYNATIPVYFPGNGSSFLDAYVPPLLAGPGFVYVALVGLATLADGSQCAVINGGYADV